jgi:hypothetical protein
MLVELAILTLATTSTGVVPAPAVSAGHPVAPVERLSAAQPLMLGADATTPGTLWLAQSRSSGSRGTRSSKSSSNRGAGGYQQSGQGGYQQTGQGGYGGSGGRRDMNITPPNSPGGLRTTPPTTPQWTPQWSPPGN